MANHLLLRIVIIVLITGALDTSPVDNPQQSAKPQTNENVQAVDTLSDNSPTSRVETAPRRTHVTSSAANVKKLSLMCGKGDQTSEGIEILIENEDQEAIAGQVTSKWLSFLKALNKYSVRFEMKGVLEEEQDNEEVDDLSVSAPFDGRTLYSESGQQQQNTGSNNESRLSGASTGIPWFLRAVRMGHLNSNTSGSSTEFWNMTAISSVPDTAVRGQFSFNLHPATNLNKHYVELVFSAKNHIDNASGQICSFTFCNNPYTVCVNHRSIITINGSLLHTVPTPYTYGEVVDTFPETTVKLVNVVCGKTKVELETNNKRPMLVFVKTKALADSVNEYAAAGWEWKEKPEAETREADDTDAETAGRRRRSADSAREIDSLFLDSAEGPTKRRKSRAAPTPCQHHKWSVGPSDLGFDGEMLAPKDEIEIGYCKGSCRLSDHVPDTAHAILRMRYINSGGYTAGNVIHIADCVPKELLPQSVVLRRENNVFDIQGLNSIKVASCECR